MSSKRLFSWSKTRQSSAEPYYKTGGLLPIDAIGNNGPTAGPEAKESQSAKRRPSDLTIVPPDSQLFTSSPLPSPHNAAVVSSASNLMAMFNDMLRSPASSSAACPRSASLHKPLPTRPRASSVPSSPDLPAELPGSLLQLNQGFPYLEATDLVPSRPVSQNVRRGTHPPDRCPEDEGDIFDLLHLFPEPLNHSKSVPSLNVGYQESAMKSSRVALGSSSSSMGKSKYRRVHHRKALSDVEWRTVAHPDMANDSTAAAAASYGASIHQDPGTYSKNSRIDTSNLLHPSPLPFDAPASDRFLETRTSRRDDLAASHTPTPTTSRSKRADGPKGTVVTQDRAISALHSQFGSLRSSHEAHVSSLAEAHAAEVASLQHYARLLEEQLGQRPSLHQASSSNLLFLLDTTESPSTPSYESSQHTAGTSASSVLSFPNVPEKQQWSPGSLQHAPDMESLKRKLSTTRRPQTADRNLLPELNQYKQNNVALQTQIGSLMAKLNESKKNEKVLKATLQGIEQRCAEAESKTSEVQQLTSSTQALQNTIDHLESRLEIANTEKLDAQEELFNMRALKSPFDTQSPRLQIPLHDAHESMDTVFSTDSPPGQQRESTATLSTFIARIEQLQDEIRQKDAYISDLQGDGTQLRQMLDRMNQQCDEINLQLDIQNELLGKTKETDAYIEQLRMTIIERENVIGEKEKSIRTVERQLEHHKLLLQAEIRKHATIARYFTNETNPLPELTALATKKDIDKWIQKLNQRLRKARPTSATKQSASATDTHMQDLRNEIDFYVREIIYYKLDIRGYKSDIRKLSKVTAQAGSCGNKTSDLDSDTSSLRPTPTPNRARFLSTTPEPRGSAQPSPAFTGPTSTNLASTRALTPPPSTTADSPDSSPSRLAKQTSDDLEEAASRVPMSPQTPTKVTIISTSYITPLATFEESHDARRNEGDLTSGAYGETENIQAPSASKYNSHSDMFAHAAGSPSVPAYHNADFVDASREAKTQTSTNMPSENSTGLAPALSSGEIRPSLERDVSSASTVRPVVPTSKFSIDLVSSSPSPKPNQSSHVRVGSESSAVDYHLQLQSSTSRVECKPSATSSTGIPFVMALDSPHNPAIAVAAKNMPVTRSQKLYSTMSRAGVGGTMASATPLPSPTSIENLSTIPEPSPPGPAGQKRKLSLSFRRQENETPSTSEHSRSLSSGSIRTAMRWRKVSDGEKDRNMQIRKDSIGMPQPPEVLSQRKDGLEAKNTTEVMDFGTLEGEVSNASR